MALELEKQRIAVRERSMLEILDLALAVIRGHGWPLIAALAIGAAPMFVLNLWLIGDLADPFDQDDPSRFPYLWALTMLMVMEIPIASAPATLYLGQSMFSEKPNLRQLANDFFKSLPQLLVLQGILRGALVVTQILGFIPFVAFPYLNEVILLERNPLRGNKSRHSSWRRSHKLHLSNHGMLLGRWLTTVVVGLLLIFAVWLSMWVLFSQLLGYWHSETIAYRYYLPISIWIVAGFMTVVRFLSYLDLRIRDEGWEVELVLRAEAARLTRQTA